MMDRNKKIRIFSLLAVMVFLVIIGLTGILKNAPIEIKNENNGESSARNDKPLEEPKEPEGEKSPVNGLACANAKKRPVAVMLGGDPESEPLSGLSEADLVVEMPVVTGGITRYMAVFGCKQPEEIGSVRSARHDYIPLAMGLGAIYVHWGGSHFALDKLNSGIMDNINALYLDGTVFYRRLDKVAPFNGFTNFERLEKYAKEKKYNMESNFEGYKFADKEDPALTNGRISIGYPSVFKVEYEYDSEKNEYRRFKGGVREIDKSNSQQVAAKNVVIMYALSRQIEGQYNDVDVEGEGKAIVYQNGKEILGKWSKDKSKPSSKLYFYDGSGQEIAFVPGQIWIQVVQPDQKVDWTAGL